jgi:hypothetical protein
MEAVILLLCLMLLPFGAQASGASPVGHWLFYKKIYQGMEIPEPPGATLRLHFEFRADGASRLYWWHEGELDRCAREGRYFVENGVIVEEATRVDPENHPVCGRDPDMREGKVSRIPFRLDGKDLYLYLPLADDTLVYVWERIEEEK